MEEDSGEPASYYGNHLDAARSIIADYHGGKLEGGGTGSGSGAGAGTASAITGNSALKVALVIALTISSGWLIVTGLRDIAGDREAV
jgi:hypothetical protein